MGSSSAPANLPPDDNRALPALSIYMWIACGVATVVVAVRLGTRLVLRQAAGWDDFFIAIAYLTALVLYIGTAVLLAHGYGHHIEYVSHPDLVILLKMNAMVNIGGFASLAFARTSIGIFLLRLVSRVKTWVWVVYFGLALNAVQAAALMILTGIRCVPIEKQWDPTHPGWCISPENFMIADRFFGTLNVVVDLIFALFPLVVIRQLQMKRKIRLATYLLLSCGLLAAVCSIGRVVASNLTVTDITWDLVPLTYWAVSEMSGVLILACMPAMHQLFHQTEAGKKLRSYVHSKTAGSKMQSYQISEPGHHTPDTDSRKDLFFPDDNIHMQKDVFVELSDRALYREDKPQVFGVEDTSYHNSAQATAGMV